MKKMIAVFALALVVLISAPLAQAQRPGKVYRIGFLSPSTAQNLRSRVAAFRKGLRDLGWIEGKNIIFEERHADGRRNLRPALAAEMIRRKPDVIVVHGGSFARVVDRAAKKAGRAIPIVFSQAPDPVGTGLVASLARPGGNITGVSDFHSDLVAKRLELLKEITPSALRFAVLWLSHSRSHRGQWKRIQAVAPKMGVEIISLEVKSLEDFNRTEGFDRVFAPIKKERPGGLVVFGSSAMSKSRERLVSFVNKHRIPTIHTGAKSVVAGSLMSYGADLLQLYRRAATYVDKILKGAKPADLPVEQPRNFVMTINLKAAKKMGITIPPEVLLQATKVIK